MKNSNSRKSCSNSRQANKTQKTNKSKKQMNQTSNEA